jgi:hypothetical protein
MTNSELVSTEQVAVTARAIPVPNKSIYAGYSYIILWSWSIELFTSRKTRWNLLVSSGVARVAVAVPLEMLQLHKMTNSELVSTEQVAVTARAIPVPNKSI